MDRIELSRTAFESLLRQLVNLEDDRLDLIERFIAAPEERAGLIGLLDRYIAGLDRIMGKAVRCETSGDTLPFVAIHSEVELQEAGRLEPFRVYIVSPLDDDIGADCISYLSPLGGALLLKGVGEEVPVTAPGGVFHYLIKSVRLKR